MSKDVFGYDIEEKPDEYYENMKVKFKGTLGQINYPKGGMEDYGYAIVRLNVLEVLEGEFHPRAYNYRNMVSVKGEMARLEANEVNEFTVEIDEISEQWGASYKLLFKRTDFDFSDVAQQRIFFEAFLSENQIVNMFEAFENPIEVLQSGDITRLCEVKGIGESLAPKIMQRYEMNKDYAEAFVELAQYDLTINAIMKLCDNYGSPDALISIIENNPYVLTEVDGYGFVKADEIAMQSGIDPNSTKRVMAFINYTLLDMGERGMSWIDSEHLIYLIEEALEGIKMQTVIDAVSELKELKLVWNETRGMIGAMRFYELELKIVSEIYRLMNAPKPNVPDGWEDRVKEAEILQGWKHTSEQMDVIKLILDNNLCIVTGKAGVGKTSSVLGAIRALGEGHRFSQCALSGKASSNLSDCTGMPASTIHRLLGFNPQNIETIGTPFFYNKNNQLHVDTVIVDECSMMGGSIYHNLLQAIPTGARLIMIGDARQLAPVGSLNVFHDILESGSIPVGRITKIQRQGAKSAIIAESHKVSDGVQLFEKDWTGTQTFGELEDLRLDIHQHSYLLSDKILEYFIQEYESVKDIMEVQVVCPVRKNGEVSVYYLNNLIQEYYNPIPEFDKELIGYVEKGKPYNFRIGDKVMCVKNNYRLEDTEGIETAVFNGYTGIIKDIKFDSMIINFPLASENTDIVVPRSFWHGKKGIELGYATTTAKSQGSGFTSVIYGLENGHYLLLNKEQVYTGITRAKKMCTIVAQSNALRRAIATNEAKSKQTFMPLLLRGELKK